uniref:G-protein coupled receptors family 3 profile domain-containing protein n=1 Tax=Periophthalmus magnuspinnatus TaxID=409849 RepID=A0A3B3ZPR8_9GOBI
SYYLLLLFVSFDVLGFRQALTMAFAVKEINSNTDLLPNVTLGYSLYDNCVELSIGFRAALSLAAGQKKHFVLNDSCVSYFATCSCLSDRTKYPAFFRTIPSDTLGILYLFITGILKHFGWSWVGLLVSDDDYGLHAAQSFQSDVLPLGEACLAYLKVLPWDNNQYEIERIVHVIKKSTARVVIAFAHESNMIPLMEEVNVIIVVTVNQFWEHTFKCRFAPAPAEWTEAGGALCTGHEDLQNIDTEFLDVSNLRPEYNVYKAVYALAHALDQLLRCEPGRGPFPGNSCIQGFENVSSHNSQFVHYLQNVNFTTSFGDEVSFDKDGDAIPLYDVMNWLWLPSGNIQVQNVGVVKKSAQRGEQLHLNEDPPMSVCSKKCPLGTRRVRRKGEPECCFDCITCSEGEISNTTVLLVFVHNRKTPIVRANNSELSFQVLLSLKLCFLCSLLFIGRPRLWTCQLRHAAFGISFVLCVSCILVKTMVVLAVFKASKPGGGSILKWFGALQQRGTVFTLTLIQAVICVTWLVTASPAPYKNTDYHNDKIVYECVIGSSVGFAVLLGYIGLLALLSFMLAFLARNLPDNFNEAKLITFSMLMFCAVWVAFVPAYVNSPGKYADAVEVFAILASSFGLLVALFGPKCYIILFRPERNTKKLIKSYFAGISPPWK